MMLKEFLAIAKDPLRKGQLRKTGEPSRVRRGRSHRAGRVPSEHVYHAAMEPMNSTAWVRGEEVDLWSPTQGQLWSQEVAAKAAGTSVDKVRVHTTLLGGGFWLKTEQLANQQAAQLSRLMAKPVKVIWSREDDLKNGAY
jgi:isoquinoline 1-oxidoreductase beta subunit